MCSPDSTATVGRRASRTRFGTRQSGILRADRGRSQGPVAARAAARHELSRGATDRKRAPSVLRSGPASPGCSPFRWPRCWPCRCCRFAAAAGAARAPRWGWCWDWPGSSCSAWWRAAPSVWPATHAAGLAAAVLLLAAVALLFALAAHPPCRALAQRCLKSSGTSWCRPSSL